MNGLVLGVGPVDCVGANLSLLAACTGDGVRKHAELEACFLELGLLREADAGSIRFGVGAREVMAETSRVDFRLENDGNG